MKMEDQGQLARIQNVDLPADIMHDIFSRLPVKPLCRFKCVSKAWHSLISDPDFVVNYSKDRRRLFFTYINDDYYRNKYQVYSLNLDQFLNENPNVDVDGLEATATELDFGRDWDFHCGSIRYSCYGLFLCGLYSSTGVGRHWGLINPATKESKKLPKPPIWRLPMKPFKKLYGFGFDHSTNEHKVIYGQDYKGEGIEFSVYTLQTDSWRQIDHLYPYTFESEGVLVKGDVHWLVSKVADGSSVIISFHSAEEVVRELALPPPDAPAAYMLRLGSFRNSLYMTWSPTMMVYEFWVMKEYGVQESWTKMQISKPYHQYRISHSGFWTESHDLMVFKSSLLVMYNFNDGTFWNLSVGLGDFGSFWDIGVYVESLPLVSMRRVKKINPLHGVLKYLSSCF